MRPFLPYFAEVPCAGSGANFWPASSARILYGVVGGLGHAAHASSTVIPRVLPARSAGRPQQTHKASGFFLDLEVVFRPVPAAGPAACGLGRGAGAHPRLPPTPRGPSFTPWQVWTIAMWLPLVFVIRGIAGYLNTYLIQFAGVRILEEIRTDYFRKLCRDCPWPSFTGCRAAS